MKKKAFHLLECSQADVLRLWERDYNLKALLPQHVILTAGHGKKNSTFDDFLLADNFNSFDGIVPIDQYHDYCEACWTLFGKCPNVIVW